MSQSPEPSEIRSERWPKTLWDVLESEDEDRILKHLCEQYRTPIVEWFRKDPYLHGEAEDLTQNFIAGNWAEGRIRFRRDPAQGTRFRSWLVTCLGRFLSSAKRRKFAEKRGAGQVVAPLDEQALEVGGGVPVVAEGVDRPLAVEIDGRAMAAVRARWEAKGWGDRFRCLSDYVPGSDDPPNIAALAAASGLGEGNVKKQLHEMREAYLEAFESEVRPLCSTADFQGEFRHLLGLAAVWVAQGGRRSSTR